jgi:hypothetical protein
MYSLVIAIAQLEGVFTSWNHGKTLAKKIGVIECIVIGSHCDV